MKPTQEQAVEWFHAAGESAGWKPGFGNPLVINYLTHFAALAFAAGQASKSEWQPIATAPKDGTVFLGYRDGKMRESYRVQRPDCEMWVFGGSSGAVEIAPQLKPTHWMPLPAAPSQETGE